MLCTNNNQVDEFVIEAVTLKKLKKIRIGHHGDRAGDGWFLDSVVVHPVDDASNAVEFKCNRYTAHTRWRTSSRLRAARGTSHFCCPFCIVFYVLYLKKVCMR